MDIDEFLDKEIKAQEKYEDETSPIEVSKEETDNIRLYFDLWKKISEIGLKWDDNIYISLEKTGERINDNLKNLSVEIQRKKKIILSLLDRINKDLESKNFESATKLYSEVAEMRNSFPDFLLQEKKELNIGIFQVYAKLHNFIDAKFIKSFRQSIAKVSSLVSQANTYFEDNKLEEAKVSYSKALVIYKNLPNGFLSQKMEIGSELLKLYKDLSIQSKINALEQQLSTRTAKSKNDNIKRLSKVIRKHNIDHEHKVQRYNAISDLLAITPAEKLRARHKTLLQRLVTRKLDKAKINMKKKLFQEAKKDLDAVIKVDPRNIEAKQMLSQIPIQYKISAQ